MAYLHTSEALQIAVKLKYNGVSLHFDTLCVNNKREEISGGQSQIIKQETSRNLYRQGPSILHNQTQGAMQRKTAGQPCS